MPSAQPTTIVEGSSTEEAKMETTLRGDGTGASHTTALKDKTAIGGNCTLSFFSA